MESRHDYNPSDWASHRFGVSEARWSALSGRIMLVTGAGTGIGRAVSIALAAAGAHVVLSGRRMEKLEETLSQARDLGVPSQRCLALPMDVRDERQVEQLVGHATQQIGSIEGLVHCAALPPPASGPRALAQTEPSVWRDQIATNVTGPWLLTRAVLEERRAARLRVVFLTSAAGWGFAAGAGPYNVSKSALNNLSASFAAECATAEPTRDAQFNAVDPGQVRSEMNAGSPVSPYTAVNVILLLLSHPAQGPNGFFFRADGSSTPFGHAGVYPNSLA